MTRMEKVGQECVPIAFKWAQMLHASGVAGSTRMTWRSSRVFHVADYLAVSRPHGYGQVPGIPYLVGFFSPCGHFYNLLFPGRTGSFCLDAVLVSPSCNKNKQTKNTQQNQLKEGRIYFGSQF